MLSQILARALGGSVGRNPAGLFVLTGALRLKCDQACRRTHAALGGVIQSENWLHEQCVGPGIIGAIMLQWKSFA